MKSKILIILVLWLVGLCNLSFSQNTVGTSAVTFLGIPIGPRAQAMGETYTAMVNDVSAAYWNPAGLANIGKIQVLISHTEWFLGTDFNWVGINIALNEANAIAFSLTHLDYGEEEIITIFEQEGTGRYWNALDLAFSISYATRLTPRFSLGGSVKIINSTIYNESATGYAVDLGVLYQTQLEGLRLGMQIANYGTKMQMDGRDLVNNIDLNDEYGGNNNRTPSVLKTDEWPIPIFFKVGVAWDIFNRSDNRVTIVTDALHPTNNVEIVNTGMEYSWNEMVFLRGGFARLFEENREGGLTLGGGFQYEVPNFARMQVDYAWSDYGIITPDGVQTLALTISF